MRIPALVVTLVEGKQRNPDERDATIDEFLASSGAPIREGAGDAYSHVATSKRRIHNKFLDPASKQKSNHLARN
jgi:hypothetical protein